MTTRDVQISILPTTDSKSKATDFRISLDNDTTSLQSSIKAISAHYRFNGNAKDQTINKNDGSGTNLTATTDRFGNENSAYKFSGISYVKVPMSESLTIEEDMTISFWMLPEAPENDDCCMRILSTQSNDYNVEIQTSDIAGEKMWNLYVSPGANSFRMGEPGYLFSRDEWINVTVTSENILNEEGNPTGFIKMVYYYNGSKAYSQQNEGNGKDFGSNYLYIGAGNENWARYYGKLDDVKIYNYALTEDQVYENYSLESQGETSVTSIVNMVTIPSGSKSQRFYVFAEDDDEFNEGKESLLLEIDSAVNAKIGTNTPINIEILDNDIKPTVSLSKISGDQLLEGSNKYITIDAKIDSVTTRDIQISVLPNNDSEASKEDIRISLDNDTTSSSSITKLVMHYTFDGDVNDQSENGYNGTVQGASLTQDTEMKTVLTTLMELTTLLKFH